MHLDHDHSLNLTIHDIVGNSLALLGITGSGKTNTAAVLIEELLTQGLPLTIVDIEGEYYGLKQSYELLVAGRSEHAELEVTPDNAASLAELSLQRSISLILDLSDYSQEEQFTFLLAYFTRLWEVAGKERKPYQIVLEEAHEFIPQGVRTPLKQVLTRIALRGRKRGLGIILASQRSAKVEKDVLTQTSLLFLHKVVHPTDMRVYDELVPLPAKEVDTLVTGLQKGQVIVVSNHVPRVVQMRLRHTFHAGATPEFGVVVQPELRKVDATMLQELQAMIQDEKHEGSTVEGKQARRIKELETLLAARDAEIARLQERLATVSQLSIALPETLAIEKATVQHMHTPNGRIAPVHVVEAAPLVVQQKSVAQQQIAAPLNEVKFTSFKKRIDVVPAMHRDILKLLTERGERLSLIQIAAWLNRSENYMRSNPPHILIKMGLIDRVPMTGGEYWYRSLLRQRLASDFPGVDVEMLVHRLFP